MSPAGPPDDRRMRRMLRDVTALERERRSAAAPPRESPDGRPLLAPRADPEAPDDAWDVVPQRERHRARRSEVARKHADRLVTATEPVAGAGESFLPGEAIVVSTARGPCEVELPDGTLARAHLPKALARERTSEITVGDRVRLARRPAGELAVALVLPRATRLSRPDPFDPRRERVLAANLELAVVVASLRHPPLSTGLIDRFLVALAHGGVAALVAVNKVDLVPDAAERRAALALLSPYERLGTPVVACSVRTGEGLEELRERIRGRLVAFVGHSGVGKSSLLNAIAPESAAEVGAVGASGGKGRHTTSRSRIYRLAEGTRIIDTPGIREFGLWNLSPRELAAYFDEFAEASRDCRFADCSHRHEPRCGVRAAAERGTIAPERFATYLRILESMERP